MMIDLKKYTHIIWDWNGTLLDDAWLCVDVMNGMLKERKLPIKTVEEYRELFDFPVKDYYVKLGFDFKAEPFDDVGLEFITRYNIRLTETSLHPLVPEVLSRFESRGFIQHILSAREQNELVLETRLMGVFRFFEHIRGLDDHYAHGKTDVGLHLIQEIGVPAANMLFFGDTRHDAEVAKAIGIDCILISNGHHSEKRLSQFEVPIIPSLNHLIKLL
jgi:phosphoglycolate phosphatase